MSRNKIVFPYVLVLSQTAICPSDPAGLRWERIDFDRRLLILYVAKYEARTVPSTKTVLTVLQKINFDHLRGYFIIIGRYETDRLLRTSV